MPLLGGEIGLPQKSFIIGVTCAGARARVRPPLPAAKSSMSGGDRDRQLGSRELCNQGGAAVVG